MRQMTLVAFLQAQNCSNFAGSWRHPELAHRLLVAGLLPAHIARVLEAGKFDLAFFDDRLAMPDMYGDDHAQTVAARHPLVKLDPIVVLMAMAHGDRRGSASAPPTRRPTTSRSTSPALFATLDLMTERPRGLERRHLAQRRRGAEHGAATRSSSTTCATTAPTSSWRSCSATGTPGRTTRIIVDKASGRFADPDKVHRLDHGGRYFRSRGPFTVPRSPQGHPVLIQAGPERPRHGASPRAGAS